MKAISLWQPWASLWCSGIKICETRHWPTKHVGWLVVHAAKRIEHEHPQPLMDILDGEFGKHWGLDLPRGAIVGRVRLIGCQPTAEIYYSTSRAFKNEADQDDFYCGDFTPGRFAWRAQTFETFKEPIPYRGAQGFFEVPDAILPKLTA